MPLAESLGSTEPRIKNTAVRKQCGAAVYKKLIKELQDAQKNE